MDEPTSTPCVVTCHTETCPLAGEPRTVNLYPNPAPPTYRAWCGQCGNAITDVVPVS
jgi:hypothetical protein